MSPERLKVIKELLSSNTIGASIAAKRLFEVSGYTFLYDCVNTHHAHYLVRTFDGVPTEWDAMAAEVRRLEDSAPA